MTPFMPDFILGFLDFMIGKDNTDLLTSAKS